MKKNQILFLSMILILSHVFIGCFGGVKDLSGVSSSETINDIEISVEAYLFDVKLRRKGKPTTIRLDLYQTDTVVAMYGRGYFNKGAFGGQLTNDSMLIYFPSTQEYLYETIEDLFLSFDCESELIGLNLLSYFIDLPESGHISENLNVTTIEEKDGRRIIEIYSVNCPWKLLLEYSKENKGWRIEDFEFDDAKDVTLKGSRRQYKEKVSVSALRFRTVIPPDAFRITL